jgi:4-alpha-glucanotransferase
MGCSKRLGIGSEVVPVRTSVGTMRDFVHDQDRWLQDYSLFRALKAKFENAHYLAWPTELVQRQPAALEQMRGELSNQIGQACFAQFLLWTSSVGRVLSLVYPRLFQFAGTALGQSRLRLGRASAGWLPLVDSAVVFPDVAR